MTACPDCGMSGRLDDVEIHLPGCPGASELPERADSPAEGETISVLLDGNRGADLQVEEFHPYEPSNYVLDPGWTCFDLNTDTEYFVSTSGDVFLQPENRSVGVAPRLKEAADKMEALLAQEPDEASE